jgi:hypothetical protein
VHAKPTPLPRPNTLADMPPHDPLTRHEEHVASDPNHIAQPAAARDGRR